MSRARHPTADRYCDGSLDDDELVARRSLYWYLTSQQLGA